MKSFSLLALIGLILVGCNSEPTDLERATDLWKQHVDQFPEERREVIRPLGLEVIEANCRPTCNVEHVVSHAAGRAMFASVAAEPLGDYEDYAPLSFGGQSVPEEKD